MYISLFVFEFFVIKFTLCLTFTLIILFGWIQWLVIVLEELNDRWWYSQTVICLWKQQYYVLRNRRLLPQTWIKANFKLDRTKINLLTLLKKKMYHDQYWVYNMCITVNQLTNIIDTGVMNMNTYIYVLILIRTIPIYGYYVCYMPEKLN